MPGWLKILVGNDDYRILRGEYPEKLQDFHLPYVPPGMDGNIEDTIFHEILVFSRVEMHGAPFFQGNVRPEAECLDNSQKRKSETPVVFFIFHGFCCLLNAESSEEMVLWIFDERNSGSVRENETKGL
jgi:hypothetical protein